ncbi:hypothetical protein JMJ35_002553 [Cladonia borealis]|uniref:BTB domain-containing protein n=1 Tax=Cladonia borealis TaxID=184061 RepID=A0AA39V6X5_9LECA|nr:hypothetical protein JMJ35_002553 [Cladonia borealis]
MTEERSTYKGVFPDAADMLEGSPAAVHVGCGDAKKIWHLPETLLKSKSEFFTKALEGGFTEGISKIITLPEENPDIFKYFVEWLYIGDDQLVVPDSDTFVCLWTLGDRLVCPLLQDGMMCDLIACHSDYYMGEGTLKQIYDGSTRGSKLRQFAVDQCLFDVRKRYAQGNEKLWSYSRFVKDNEDFAQQLAEATILLGDGNPRDPLHDKSPYLLNPPPCTSKMRYTSDHGMPPYLLAFIWDACAPGSKLHKFALDQCVIYARMGGFDAPNKEAIIRFAEEHEDFAKAYVAVSITNGHRERRDLLQDLGDYSSIAKPNE